MSVILTPRLEQISLSNSSAGHGEELESGTGEQGRALLPLAASETQASANENPAIAISTGVGPDVEPFGRAADARWCRPPIAHTFPIAV